MIDPADVRIEYMRGTGAGGQHKNKTDSACRVTHVPTGVQAYSDKRSQKHSLKSAMAELQSRITSLAEDKLAAERKSRRDEAIKPSASIRTYHYCRGTVKDHRTGKTASLKEVMGKGRIDLLK